MPLAMSDRLCTQFASYLSGNITMLVIVSCSPLIAVVSESRKTVVFHLRLDWQACADGLTPYCDNSNAVCCSSNEQRAERFMLTTTFNNMRGGWWFCSGSEVGTGSEFVELGGALRNRICIISARSSIVLNHGTKSILGKAINS